MASTNKTENLGLPKWESKAETFTMEDMTGAFEAIDRAVSERLTFGLVKEYTIPASGTKTTDLDISDLNFGDYYMVLFYFPRFITSEMSTNASSNVGHVNSGALFLFFPLKDASIYSFGINVVSSQANGACLGPAIGNAIRLTFTAPSSQAATFSQEFKMQVWGLK